MTGTKILEADVLRELLVWLDSNAVQHNFLFWRSNNVPVFAKNNAGRMVYRSLPKHTPKGLPDIMLIYKGIFIGVEVKRPGAFLSPDQRAFMVSLKQHGGIYIVAQSVIDLKEGLRVIIDTIS